MATIRTVRRKGEPSREPPGPPPAEVGIVLTDLFFKPLAYDRGAVSILAAVSGDRPPDADGPQKINALPDEILDALRDSRPSELETVDLRFYARKREYVGRVYLVKPQSEALPEALFALHLERDVAVSDALLQVGNEYHLTEREKEALRGIATGLSTKELAHRMSVTPNTVKVFLRLIMIKMGVPNRAGVVAAILRTATSGGRAILGSPKSRTRPAAAGK